ncbi:glycerol-3-phosphate 1-O-acyltransferase PlsY [Butyrivibrio sp. MC2013]|uniref:glycerol-3-phosphate 1-O-acyltransferase PlsY n=1 Tax=Butyrivibrio sp. MC2013 TaxID=1280686 RepID=UPI0004192F09|nr:glycerol-3-phosphate 1-O-acyltransferase PlsY [Butyrivibrio sp. MC2013]
MTMTSLRFICIAIGYVFGMIQTAYFYGRLKGIDIRQYGSGNAGTTNTLRVLGAKAGFIVLFGDMLKCALAVCLVGFLFSSAYPEHVYLLKMYTAFGAILGHDFPFYMKFKGGKGIAATCGFMIAFHWTFIPMFLIVFLLIFNLTHYVSLGSLALYLGFVILLMFEGEKGLFGFGAMAAADRVEMYIIAIVMTCLAFWQHRSNINKLVNHTERKTYIFKKKNAED